MSLPHFSNGHPGFFPGLCDAFDGGSDVFIKHMGVAQRALDVGMVHRLLHQLQVAGVAQQLGAEVVAEVVEAEILDARLGAYPLPSRFGSVERERIALPCTLPRRLLPYMAT